MIFCDKNYFFGGGASATSSRDSAPSLLRRKEREVFFPFTHSEGWKKKIISRTHYHVLQTSEARIVVHKKENGMAKGINRREQEKKKKKKTDAFGLHQEQKGKRKRKKEGKQKKKKREKGSTKQKPVDTNPQHHKEKNTIKKRWNGTAGASK
jgi:hypothetical protein